MTHFPNSLLPLGEDIGPNLFEGGDEGLPVLPHRTGCGKCLAVHVFRKRSVFPSGIRDNPKYLVAAVKVDHEGHADG